MKEIQLTQGQVALIDDEDLILISQYKWFAQYDPTRNDYYAVHTTGRDTNGKQKRILMHRLILNAPSNMQVDHRNRSGVDNRRQNLRLCAQSDNQHNRAANSNNTSGGLKGVSLHLHSGKFQASITNNSKQVYLGLFVTAEQAAAAYKEAALRLHGEFARTE